MANTLNTSFRRPQFDFSSVLGILGAFIFFLGFALISPLVIALIYGEAIWNTFLYSAAIAFVVGGALYYFFKTDPFTNF